MIKRYKPFNFEEARRNPELNLHIGAWDYVEKYKNDPDVYISFTEIDKIGINPQSKYNTPVGIYTYPLKEFVRNYIDKEDGFELRKDIPVGHFAPFAGKSKYINFIRLKDKAHFINDMYKDYGSNDYDRDIKILEKKYSKYIKLDEYEYSAILRNLIAEFKEYPQFDPTRLAQLIYYVLPPTINIDNRLIIKAVEKYEKEMHEALVKEDKDSIEFALENIISEFNLFKYFVDNAVNTSKSKNPIMSMWNLTRLLAKYLSDNEKQASTKWNLILSKDLGYSGFADKSGKGYIHPSEPMQAVFFNTRAFEVITRVENVPAKKVIDNPVYKIGDSFKNTKSRVIYTIKKIGFANEIEYMLTSFEGNSFYKQQSYIQKLLKDGDWKKE